jgi:hypothetical protein
MALRVVSCCTYLTEVGSVTWRARDHDAHDFVMAMKAKPINGFAQVPCRGELHRIDDGNRDLALRLFARMVADVAAKHGLAFPCALVPVPNSRCQLESRIPPRTLEQAQALAAELGTGASVVDALRWAEPLASASVASGMRDAQRLFDKLRVIGTFPEGLLRYVLVDDVLTSGGHLQACAAMLSAHGHPVELALVAGRADRAQVAEPFTMRVDVLADFRPHRGSATTL